MKIKVRVIPNAKKNLIKKENEALKVYLVAPAVGGKANQALVEILAQYWNVRKSQIEIIKGLHSREKMININPNLSPSQKIMLKEENEGEKI